MIDGATGVINAGGRGLRLGGVRKALLEDAHGNTLLERTLGKMRERFSAVLLVANEREPYECFGIGIVSDLIADRGAPGGLHAALTAAKTPWIFFAACDMPALDPRVIDALAARRSGMQCVLALVDGRAEPLHAFWSRAALPALESLLRSGEPSFRDLADAIPTARVPIADLEREIPGATNSFANVNTPEDLERFGLRLPR